MSKFAANAGCGSGHDAQSITRIDALARIRAALRPVGGTEWLPVKNAHGRVLAAAIATAHDVPGHTNSAMDGYAVRAADAGLATLTRVGSAFAGHPYAGVLGAGECVRIMTGGVVPAGADTVVMQEHVRAQDERIHIDRWPSKGENVRHAGEDLPRGTTVASPGRRLTSADLGVIAATGTAEIAVHRRVRAAFFSTGDELRSLGEPLATGQIYDSNRYTLHAMLTRLGCEVLDMGVVRDDPEAVRRALRDGSEYADVVLTSGGVSVGSADYVTSVLAELGAVGFWTVAIKPGRPLAFGRVGAAAFFGLPGNPVSSMVTFAQLVTPAIGHLAGETPRAPMRFQARTTTDLRKKPGREEFQRGRMDITADGTMTVTSVGSQGSGILSSMSAADCFIVLPLESDGVAAGDWVSVEPFTGPLA